MTRTIHTPALAAALVLAGLAAPVGAAVAATDTTPTTEEAAPTSESGPPPTPPEPVEVAGDPACSPYVNVTLAFSSEQPDPEAITALLDELDANVPDDLAEDLPVMTTAARAVLDSDGQDFSPFETPEFTEAQTTVDGWMFETCEFDQKLEVATVEYGFDGLPEELEPGLTAILLTNDGAQAHELALLRRNDDVTESWAELLELPEEEAMTKASFVGAGFVPMTGSTTLVVADLEPGDYAALCFVPVGSMMHDEEMTEGTGPPHFIEGMMQEFTVAG